MAFSSCASTVFRMSHSRRSSLWMKYPFVCPGKQRNGMGSSSLSMYALILLTLTRRSWHVCMMVKYSAAIAQT